MKAALAAALAIAAAATGCAGHLGIVPRRDGTGPLVATYRAAVADGGAGVRHARIVLWAEMPDRLHAELLSPVGGVRFTLDAGGGRACVVDAAEGVAYVGSAGTRAVEAIAGVPLTVSDAVRALLFGLSRDGLAVDRRGGSPGSLPERVRLVAGTRSLTLTRLDLQRASSGSGIGTGEPPPDLPVRPLDEMRADGSSP